MRIGLPTHSERFGSNLFYSVQKVFELDAGPELDPEFSSPFHVVRQIPQAALHQIEQDMAIVIPVKNEKLRLLEGVLSGIPNACLPIVMSNSQREPTDRFQMESLLLNNFCHSAKKKYLHFHQRDPLLASLFADNYPEILDETGLIRHGKAEGMIAATALAHALGKKYIGFIDSDNYFPGSVLEYVRLYAAGFAQAQTDHTMVRIQWQSKPKIVDNELYFARLGRVTRITNQYLNQLLSLQSGFETDLLLTGNAGEHAISMNLALKLSFASGFAVETNHFISMLEYFGGVLPTPFPEVMKQGVEVFQMQSRNPHFHDFSKGDDHLSEMIEASLAVIYHSQLCPKVLKKQIQEELKRLKILRAGQAPQAPRLYKPLGDLDIDKWRKTLDWSRYGNFQGV